jgi:hypothetical protein
LAFGPMVTAAACLMLAAGAHLLVGAPRGLESIALHS